jgi:renalase
MMRVAVIGAGMAGLACARRLADAGLAPVVFDKGRGLGGRLATRRVDGLQFNHGAQYVTARDAGFAPVLRDLLATAAAGLWQTDEGAAHWVGVPGMSALARALALGLQVRHPVQVTSVHKAAGQWSVRPWR